VKSTWDASPGDRKLKVMATLNAECEATPPPHLECGVMAGLWLFLNFPGEVRAKRMPLRPEGLRSRGTELFLDAAGRVAPDKRPTT